LPSLSSVCAVLALCLLAACATHRAAAPPPTQPAKPVVARDGAEGEYRGTATRYQADSRQCPHPGLVTLIVFDDRFQYRWDHETWLDATIGADGVVHGNGPGISLQGRREGARIEGDVTNGVCGLHFTVTRSAA
jgi:hypothetical protein